MNEKLNEVDYYKLKLYIKLSGLMVEHLTDHFMNEIMEMKTKIVNV